MKKILLFLSLLASVPSVLTAQSFDSTAYKNLYRQNFESVYFEEEFTPATKIAGLSKAWAEAKFNFANFDLIPTLKWDSLYHAYIPKVLETKNPVDYYKTLATFYAALGDGHSLIIPPKALWDSTRSSLPIRARLIEDQVVITELKSTEEQYQILQPGTIILKVNEEPVKVYAEKYIAPYLSYSTPQDKMARMYSFFFTNGNISEPIKLEVKTRDGRNISRSFIRKSRDQMFPAASGYSYELIDPHTRLLTIKTFNEQNLVPYLDSIFQQVPQPQNLIIDIRSNGGGNGNNGFELLGYLTKKNFNLGVNVQRQYQPTQRAWQQQPDKILYNNYDWKPYKGPTFTGKVVVLSGPDTYSAAEDFLVAFKAAKRGLVIGQPTGGSTGQPLFFPLPFGGMGAVCSKRDLMADTTEFVGVGIKPDTLIEYKLENYLNGKDEAVEEALRTFRAGL